MVAQLPRLRFRPHIQLHLYFVRATHHVGIRQNIAVRTEQDAGTAAALFGQQVGYLVRLVARRHITAHEDLHHASSGLR